MKSIDSRLVILKVVECMYRCTFLLIPWNEHISFFLHRISRWDTRSIELSKRLAETIFSGGFRTHFDQIGRFFSTQFALGNHPPKPKHKKHHQMLHHARKNILNINSSNHRLSRKRFDQHVYLSVLEGNNQDVVCI